MTGVARDSKPAAGHVESAAGSAAASTPGTDTLSAVVPANVAASMSLLVDLVTNSLEPEYARVAARPRGLARSVTLRRLTAFACIAALGVLLGLGARRQRVEAPTAARAHAKLVEQVRSATATVNALADTADALRADSDRLRAAALGSGSSALAARLAAAQQASASTAETGPGLHLSIDDAPVAPGATADPASRVTDRDLQRVVNGLWASGAEAISIGGVRLTARSSIRTAGEAVLVDFRPVTLPYSIDAIGDPATLDSAFAASTGAIDMRALAQAYGIRFSVARAATLTVPAGTDLELRVASPLPSTQESAGTPPPDSTPSGGGSSP